MKSTLKKTTVNGTTFERWHYEAATPKQHRQAATRNAFSPWTTLVATAEYNDELQATGWTTGIEIKVWATQEVIKIEGAERLSPSAAGRLAQALQAATQLLTEMTEQTRCPNHGEEGTECEACFQEQDPETYAELVALTSTSN